MILFYTLPRVGARCFQAFSIFTGLGIHNCQMYENACRLMAKQTVALEVLSFHATAGKEETEKLVVSLNLFSFVLSSVIPVDNI